MTLALICGAIVALYFLWLLFRLATLALPVAAAVGVAFTLLDREFGYGTAIGSAFVAGGLVLVGGRLAFSAARSTLGRAPVALLFVLPAGIAGYQAGAGLAALSLGAGPASLVAAPIVGILAAASAWRSLSRAGHAAAGAGMQRSSPTVTDGSSCAAR